MPNHAGDILDRFKDSSRKRALHSEEDLRGELAAIAAPKNADRTRASDLDEARAWKTRKQAELVEIQLAEKRGELVPMRIAEDELERICLEIRAQLLTIPNKWSPVLAGLTRREVQIELQKAVDDALEALSRGLKIPERKRGSRAE